MHDYTNVGGRAGFVIYRNPISGRPNWGGTAGDTPALAYDACMRWTHRFESHPQFGQAVRFATGRPPWVLKATGLIAVLAFAIPVAAAVVLLIAAGLVTALAWTVFSAIGRVLDALTGRGRAKTGSQTPEPASDGRENVRVMNRR